MARPKSQSVSAATVTVDPLASSGWPDWADPLASRRLRNIIGERRIGHAYLLSGPRGVGKAQLAIAFAQALCCTNVDADDRSQPCGACRACRNVQRGAHPDVERFDIAAQNALAENPTPRATLSIDTVRRLRSSAALLPLEASRRILIVDDAESLLEPAQQALLKTLEEPPPAVTLLLLADEPETLLETVRSRCQEVSVRPVAEPLVIAALSDRGVEPDLAHEIARLSRGCPGWALTAAGDRATLQGRRQEWSDATAWVGAAPYERLVTAYRLGEQFSKRRSDVLGVVQAAVQLLRDRMIAAAGRQSTDAAAGAPAPDARAAFQLGVAVAASLKCLGDLEANVRPRLALEAMVLQWPNLDHQQT